VIWLAVKPYLGSYHSNLAYRFSQFFEAGNQAGCLPIGS
jgi:hypothetical protein